MEAETLTPTSTATNDDSDIQILYSSEESDDDNVFQMQAQRVESPQLQVEETQEEPEQSPTVFRPDGPTWHAYARPSGSINVRTGPSTSYDQMFRVAQGTRGRVVERRDGWTQITWDFNNQTGWVRDDLVIQGPASVMTNLVHSAGGVDNVDSQMITQAAIDTAIVENRVIVAEAKPASVEDTVETLVTSDNLPTHGTIRADPVANIRSAPGTQNERISRLPKGVVVQIKDVQQLDQWQWFEIIFNEGRSTGWTREDNLSF